MTSGAVRLAEDAKLRVNACVEDIDYGDLRGLKRAEMAALADAEWIVHQPEYVGGNGGFRKW